MIFFNKCSIQNINNITSRYIVIDTHGNIYIYDPVNKERVNQFHVGYMAHTSLKKHRIHGDQVIYKHKLAFKLITVKCIKNELSKNNVFVLSFIMFYEK